MRRFLIQVFSSIHYTVPAMMEKLATIKVNTDLKTTIEKRKKLIRIQKDYTRTGATTKSILMRKLPACSMHKKCFFNCKVGKSKKLRRLEFIFVTS